MISQLRDEVYIIPKLVDKKEDKKKSRSLSPSKEPNESGAANPLSKKKMSSIIKSIEEWDEHFLDLANKYHGADINIRPSGANSNDQLVWMCQLNGGMPMLDQLPSFD